ncbi:5-oxoprolinase subunit PxpB [Croceitalea rosinachiae]|uniref:5-oxoprolinase subunit PxpB n=1 Tax=Croceitalea rosinachiae TaxID=3075596 RepID=A0ABU3AC38_9FLAO|nr:5-oxoprolinase subunit PxpB [Croceitalea sp. F388]MDT0607736.1 5-oxoprolinase subunit PxpB [Croceitalea sp. F388]
MRYPITIKPFGAHSILVEWPNNVADTILEDILQFNTFLETKLEGQWEFVPSYNSLALIQDSVISDFKILNNQLLEFYRELDYTKRTERHLWKLPVCYDLEFGLDLEEVSKKLNMSISDLISNHSSNEYTVYGIGFLPGFMYLGGLPQSLEIARKETPRLKVAKGAVGLAGKQTGIYPQESPGGWNIIGSCPIPIFNVNSEKPCFVSVGDKIKFEAISRAEYELHKIEGEVGIYQPNKTILDA